MRTLTKVLATAMICGACANASNPEVDAAAAANAIRSQSEELASAEAAKNLDKAMTFWAADAIVQLNGMPQISGIEGVKQGYQEFFAHFPDKFESSTSTVTVAKSGDIAWENGVNHYTTAGVVTNAKYLAVWKNVDGAWKLAALALTDDSAPAPAAAPEKK